MTPISTFYEFIKVDGFVKSLQTCHSGESRSPELVENTGFRLEIYPKVVFERLGGVSSRERIKEPGNENI
jgi:hypothetical protein